MVEGELNKLLDTGAHNSLIYREDRESQDKAISPNKGGASAHHLTGRKEPSIIIPKDVWESDFIPSARYLSRYFPDATIYDLFMWVREELNGCQPFSDAMLERVDREIENELGPF